MISFIEDDSLKGRKIDISSLYVIKYTTARSDEEVDTTAQCPSLVLDIDSTVDSQRIKLIWMVF